VSAEFDQLVAQFERFQSQMHRVDDQFANLGDMRQQLVELEAVATSPDRAVTVVAGPSGSIKDIRLTDQAMRRAPHELAAVLKATLHQAVAEAARRQAGIVEHALGDDMHLTEQVLETQAQLFGMSKEDLRAATEQDTPAAQASPPAASSTPAQPQWMSQQSAPPKPPRRPESAPQDDFSERNVLRGDSWNAPTPPAGPPSKKDDRFLNLYPEDDQ